MDEVRLEAVLELGQVLVAGEVLPLVLAGLVVELELGGGGEPGGTPRIASYLGSPVEETCI